MVYEGTNMRRETTDMYKSKDPDYVKHTRGLLRKKYQPIYETIYIQIVAMKLYMHNSLDCSLLGRATKEAIHKIALY